MTLSIPSLRNGAIGVLALAYTSITFGAALAPAPVYAADGAYYRAELAQPAKEDRAVAGGVAWFCKGNVCVAERGNSRPVRMCESLVRELGPVADFKVDGDALEAEQLATCNA